MAISKTELENILRKEFPEADILIQDFAGDGDHYSLEISDKVFSGKKIIEQHKMVKNCLKDALSTNLHAITIKTSSK